MEACLADGCLGLKHALAYLRPIDCPSRADIPSLRGCWPLKEGATPHELRAAQDLAYLVFLELADDLALPFQMHTGMSVPSHQSNPMLLEPLFRRYANIRFILLHTYPFTREASYLARQYANVYLDNSWLAMLVPASLQSVMAEWMDFVPMEKVMASTDSVTCEDFFGAFQVNADAIDDFFWPAWHECFWDGHLWAIGLQTNPCYAFIWNRTYFKEAGLNSDVAPTTIAELDLYANKLTKRDASGKITRMGFMPTHTGYAFGNAIFNWGSIFGADFYDAKKNKVTANHPKAVEALEWMASYSRLYGWSAIQAIAKAAGSWSWHPFPSGKVAMELSVPNLEVDFLRDSKIEYGLSPDQPYPPGGRMGFSWDGGWTLGIPNGAKHPNEAWEFIKWLTASEEGSTLFHKLTSNLTAYRKSPVYTQMAKDPFWKKAVLDVLEKSRFSRPIMPLTNQYLTALGDAMLAAASLTKSPQQALDLVTKEYQTKLDRFLSRKRRK